jgi:hypothetical protein
VLDVIDITTKIQAKVHECPSHLIKVVFIILDLSSQIIIKERLNSDGQQFHQYQQNVQSQSYLTFT